MVDVTDIGRVTAAILANLTVHQNRCYELTCSTKLTFAEMAEDVSTGLGIDITYKSPSLLNFYFTKKRKKMATGFILVLILLHYFPRFQKEPSITDCIKVITGKSALEFGDFINNNRQQLM